MKDGLVNGTGSEEHGHYKSLSLSVGALLQVYQKEPITDGMIVEVGVFGHGTARYVCNYSKYMTPD